MRPRFPSGVSERGHFQMKRSTPRSAASRVGEATSSRELLALMAQILVHTGHSPRKLTQEFAEICGGLKEPARASDPPDLNFLTGLTEVIARWHAESEFLDSKGRPLALPFKSGNRGLATLIERVLPNEDPSGVLDALMRFDGIRKEGTLYLPTDRQVRFTEQNARLYGLQALRGMLKTIEYNVTRATASSTIQERVAVNPYFPVHALEAFHRWLRSHAKEWLWKAHSYMGRRETRGSSEPTTRLSVAVFAFEDPMITGTSLAPKATRRDTAEAGGAERRRRGRGGASKP
jgi:hypothetical protein